MVRRSQSVDSRRCPRGSARDGGAQPGCIRERLRRGRRSPQRVRARRMTTLLSVVAPVLPALRAPQSRTIGCVRS